MLVSRILSEVLKSLLGPSAVLLLVLVCVSLGVRRCVSPQVASRVVSELCQMPPETPGKHGDLRGHSDAHRCCRKSLMESGLVRVGVRY